MARLRKFIKRELLDELVVILRVRFPGSIIKVHQEACGRFKHLYTIDARVPGNVWLDVMDCLDLLGFTYGNVGIMLSGK